MTGIGVGLVGYGFGNRAFHGPLIKGTEGLEVRAVLTTNPERQRQAHVHFPGTKIYADYEELLTDEDIDLVVISTPHHLHAPQAIQACERGKHVVVDKIMALSVAEAEKMMAAAKKADVMLSVFQNRRWDSDYLTVAAAIKQGLLGEPYVVESSVVGFRQPPAPTSELPWRMKRACGGGPFRDWGAHLFDQAIQLFGNRVDSVYADFQYRWPGIDVETAAVCWIRFAEGVRFRIEVGNISKIERPRWYVRGAKGALVVQGRDPQEAQLKRGVVISGTDQARMPQEAFQLESEVGELEIHAGNYRAYYQNIADVLLHNAPLAVTPASVLDSIRLIEAACRSAES